MIFSSGEAINLHFTATLWRDKNTKPFLSITEYSKIENQTCQLVLEMCRLTFCFLEQKRIKFTFLAVFKVTKGLSDCSFFSLASFGLQPNTVRPKRPIINHRIKGFINGFLVGGLVCRKPILPDANVII
jgi:hypothetical protein